MIYISHRGNLNGPDPKFENNPSQIKKAFSKGLHCEVDVWFINNHFYLGHDEPTYPVKESFLENKKLWCHAKTLTSLNKMLSNKNIHCFWHQEDKFTLTSNNYIWTFPNQSVCENSVIVQLEPENSNSNFSRNELKCYGICTDYPTLYQK